MKKNIASNASLRQKLLRAFKTCRKPLADKLQPRKLTNAVANIAVRRLLHRALQKRRIALRRLLSCAQCIKDLEISSDDFGDSCHGRSSEPFFYDSSYKMVKHATIAIDSNGRCVFAEEIGKRNPNTNRPKWWKCTSECRSMTSKDIEIIMSIKALFDKPVHVLIKGLKSIDECTEYGHYTRPILLKEEDSDSEDKDLDSEDINSGSENKNSDSEDKHSDSEDDEHSQAHTDYGIKPYYELAGHPLPCSSIDSMCQSKLRVLRAASPHFPQLRKLLYDLYEVIREHRPIESIDEALGAGDFENLCELCHISDYKCLFTPEPSGDSSVDDTEEPRRLQQPKLIDLELDLHVKHADLIAEIEKKFADDAEFPCCSCDRLLQRKQVTAFAFSDAKFCSNMWKSLKAHILEGDSEANTKTHYVCPYC